MEKIVFFSYSETDIKQEDYLNSFFNSIKIQLQNLFINYYDYREQYFNKFEISERIKKSQIAIIIVNEEISQVIKEEITEIIGQTKKDNNFKIILIETESFRSKRKQDAIKYSIVNELSEHTNLPITFNHQEEQMNDNLDQVQRFILGNFNMSIPELPYLASYEKDIISIFKRYMDNPKDEEIVKLMADGFPMRWPDVQINNHFTESLIENPLAPNGYKDLISNRVFAAVLKEYYPSECADKNGFCMNKNNFSFAEAGVRRKIRNLFDSHSVSLQGRNKIGIVVSGGIAPGINAVIHAIVDRHWNYYRHLITDSNPKEVYNRKSTLKTSVIGFKFGFKGLYEWLTLSDVDKWNNPKYNKYYEYLYDKSETLNDEEYIYQSDLKYIITSRYIDQPGSFLPTARASEFLNDRYDYVSKLVDGLVKDNIKILYIIGGEGSMQFAHHLSIYAIRENKDVSIVAIPKTMDNDILWVWKPFGFESAVSKACEYINQISWEIKSNPKLAIVQLFGSFSGFVASHAVLGSRAQNCDIVIIPEIKFKIRNIIDLIKNRLENHRQSLVVISECAFPIDLDDYINEEHVPLSDSEKDILNKANGLIKESDINAGKNLLRNEYSGKKDYDTWSSPLLKLLTHIFEHEAVKPLRNSDNFIGKTIRNKPQHLVRSIPPSPMDIIHGERLGFLAVDSAMAGCTDFMISQWLTEYCLVPLSLVTLGSKQLPITGIFWKSVIAKTGQPEKLD